MKIIYFILLFFTSLNFAHGQLKNGDVVPNYELIDINGDTINFYEELAKGKYIVLDFFTTWCSPCWIYHEGKQLKNLWDSHGPEGLNEVIIIGVESDKGTNIDDLKGTTPQTLGNWLEGTNYPIVENAYVFDDFGALGYPTYRVICPDRTVKYVERDFMDPYAPQAEDLLAYIADCDTIETETDAAILSYEGYESEICKKETFRPTYDIINLGNEEIISVNANLYKNGILFQEKNLNTNLSKYETVQIEFDEISFIKDGDIELKLTNPNGKPDEELTNNSMKIEFENADRLDHTLFELEIRTDYYGDEFYWAILNENDSIIYEGGNVLVGLNEIRAQENISLDHPSSYESNDLIVEEIEIRDLGCYKFIVNDFGNDGLCCANGIGRYVLRTSSGFTVANGGEFKGLKIHSFQIGSETISAIETLEASKTLTLFPNPVTDRLTIKLDTQKEDYTELKIYDSLGNNLFKIDNVANQNSIQIATNDWSQGIYLIQLLRKNGVISTNKVVKF